MKQAIYLLLLTTMLPLSSPAQLTAEYIPDVSKGKQKKPVRSVTGSIGIGAVGGYIACAAGLEYERFINRSGLLSARLSGNIFHGGDINFFGHEIDEGELRSKNYGYFIEPGIRFHPLGNHHRVDLGIGACAAFGYGSRRDDFFRSSTLGSEKVRVHNYFGAVLCELTANFRRRGHTGIFSLFLTGGHIYANAKPRTYTSRYDSVSSADDPGYLQFGMRFGGAW